MPPFTRAARPYGQAVRSDGALREVEQVRAIETVESHTQGMPTRVVVSGVDPIPGTTMFERREYARAHLDGLRRFLVEEPRGHASMSGAILMPACDPSADLGVLFIEVSGFLPMCGHATIGVCTVAIDKGLVTPREPETTIVLDTPAGIVRARVEVLAGVAKSVTFTNVPAFLAMRDVAAQVDGIGEVRFDLAYGGNFYAILPAEGAGLSLAPDEAPRIVEYGMRIMRAASEQLRFSHPAERRIDELRHVLFTSPPTVAGAHAKGAVVLHPGTIDRSPCGTGTSARMAQRYFRGEQRLDEEFLHESFLGSCFAGRLVEEVRLPNGQRAVVPRIRGRAWITGTARWDLDPDDPFPNGFLIQVA
jgi:proline racemase